MPYTSVTIANLALQLLGQDPITSLSDSNKRAREMNTCYDLLREAELQTNAWRFAISQERLISAPVPPGWGRRNRFILPTGFIRLLARYPEDNYSTRDWLIEGGYVVTDDNDYSLEKDAVRVATATAGTLASDFEDGDTVDGVVLATGDRILVKNQATASENGVYVVEAAGAPTRATDFDATSGIKFGWYVDVALGTVNAGRTYIVSSDDPITVGTSDIEFTQTGSSPATLNARVITNVTDVDLMAPLFRTMLSAKMAYQACEALTQSNTKWGICEQRYNDAFRIARKTNAIEKPPQIAPVDGFVQAREDGQDYSLAGLR